MANPTTDTREEAMTPLSITGDMHLWLLGAPENCHTNDKVIQEEPLKYTLLLTELENSDGKHDTCTLDLPEEECWLFRPSKHSITYPSSIKSAVQWAHDALDSSVSPLAPYRNDLLLRLEYILKFGSGHHKSFPFIGSVPSLTSGIQGLNLSVQTVSSSTKAIHNMNSGFVGSLRERNSTNIVNFKRPPRNYSQNFNDIGFSMPFKSLTSKKSLLTNNNAKLHIKKYSDSAVSSDSLHKLVDLQTIAHMQEDTLKAQVAAMAAARRGSQQSLTSSHGSLGDSISAQENNVVDSFLSHIQLTNISDHLNDGGGEASIELAVNDLVWQSTHNEPLISMQSSNQTSVKPSQMLVRCYPTITDQNLTIPIDSTHLLQDTFPPTKLPIVANSSLNDYPRLTSQN